MTDYELQQRRGFTSDNLHEPTGTGMLRWTADTYWRHPVKALAICPDGIRRIVRLNQQADTFFSWPGRVTIRGKTYRVFVSNDSDGALTAHYDMNR